MRMPLAPIPYLLVFSVACGGGDVTTSTGASGTSGGMSTGRAPTSSGGSQMPGTSDASSTSQAQTGSSTGEVTACGNGVLDPAEGCDDGNVDDGDRCSSRCALPFEVDWTFTYNGPDNQDDRGRDVVLDGAGNIFVVGSSRSLTTLSDVWIAQYAPDGTQVFATSWDAGAELSESLQRVVLHPSGDLIVSGVADSAVDDADIMVMRFSPEAQTVVWTMTHDGPDSGSEAFNDDFNNGLALDDQGRVTVSGGHRVLDNRSDAWMAQYDEDGGELWSQSFGGDAGDFDGFSAPVVDAANNIWVLLTLEDLVEGRQTWIKGYSSAGAEFASQELTWSPTELDIDPDGNIAVVGRLENQITLGKYSPDLDEVWLRAIEVPESLFRRPSRVKSDTTGYYIAGFVTVLGQSANSWVGKVDLDGTPVWSDAYDNKEISLNDSLFSLALDDADGVLVVGVETIFGEQENVWLRRYQQL